MSAVLVLAPLADDDDQCLPEPHPALVQAQRPTASQVMDAAGILGAFPGGSYLTGELRISSPLAGLSVLGSSVLSSPAAGSIAVTYRPRSPAPLALTFLPPG